MASDRRAEAQDARRLVLMYHGLHDSDEDAGGFDPRYSVLPAAFTTHLAMLRERVGRTVAPGSDGAPERSDGPSVMITFDDGDVTNATVALPWLQRLRLHAVFFITSGFVGRKGMVTPGQLRTLAEAGMTIGSHGATHRFLSTLPPAQLAEELEQSRDTLEQIIGRPVPLLALPGGRGGEREITAARQAGYRAVYGSEPGDNARWRPGRLLQRIPISRTLTPAGFGQILDGGGSAVARLRLRHSLLSMPKRVLGDDRYDRLRQALVG